MHPNSEAEQSGSEATAPWGIREEDFPANGSSLEKLQFAVGYAILAPSYNNAQPWQWKNDGDALGLYLNPERASHEPHFDERQTLIGCGATLSFLKIALHHFGYAPHVQYFPVRGVTHYLARVQLGDAYTATAGETRLFQAIPRRHTNRKLFQTRELPPEVLTSLQDQAQQEGVWVQFTEKWSQREALLDLITEGDLEQWNNAPYCRQRQHWFRSHPEAATDGIPGEALGFNAVEDHLLPVAMRHPVVAHLLHLNQIQADRNWLLAGGAPVLGVIGTEADRDSPRDYLAVGESLGRLLLQGCADGLAFSFFNSPVELFHFWPQIFRIIGRQGFLHLIFRVGYPTEDSGPTPRRSPDAVITS